MIKKTITLIALFIAPLAQSAHKNPYITHRTKTSRNHNAASVYDLREEGAIRFGMFIMDPNGVFSTQSGYEEGDYRRPFKKGSFTHCIAVNGLPYGVHTGTNTVAQPCNYNMHSTELKAALLAAAKEAETQGVTKFHIRGTKPVPTGTSWEVALTQELHDALRTEE